MRGFITLANIAAICGAHSLPAHSPPAESCGPGTDLCPWDSLPWSGEITASSKDFLMTGAGCNETNGPDAVVTFTSSNVPRPQLHQTRDPRPPPQPIPGLPVRLPTGGRVEPWERKSLSLTVKNADRVVVLEGGRVVESSSHDELMAADGLCRRLVSRQLVEA